MREIDLHNEIMELKHNLIECEDYKQMAQYFTKCVCGLRCKGVRIWMNQDLVEESLSDSTGEASYITDGYPDTMHVICEREWSRNIHCMCMYHCISGSGK